MSTKCSIAYGEKFHLYEEIGDKDSVWLQIEDSSEVSVSASNNRRSEVTVAIDIKIWREIVKGWLASQWAKDESLDHKLDTFDYSSTMEWLDKIANPKLNVEKDEK